MALASPSGLLSHQTSLQETVCQSLRTWHAAPDQDTTETKFFKKIIPRRNSQQQQLLEASKHHLEGKFNGSKGGALRGIILLIFGACQVFKGSLLPTRSLSNPYQQFTSCLDPLLENSLTSGEQKQTHDDVWRHTRYHGFVSSQSFVAKSLCSTQTGKRVFEVFSVEVSTYSHKGTNTIWSYLKTTSR